MKAEEIIEIGFDDHVDLKDKYITYNKDGDVVVFNKEEEDYPDDERLTHRTCFRDDYPYDDYESEYKDEHRRRR